MRHKNIKHLQCCIRYIVTDRKCTNNVYKYRCRTFLFNSEYIALYVGTNVTADIIISAVLLVYDRLLMRTSLVLTKAPCIKHHG